MKKEQLQQHKRVKVFGSMYTIRKINPLLDFSFDVMPQIFTAHLSKRPVDPAAIPHITQVQKALKDMKSIVSVGLVSPALVPVGKGDKQRKENGITIDDIFVDAELGSRLYLEIIGHSLNKFRGLKGLFFSIKIRRSLFTEWQKNFVNGQLSCYSPPAVTP